MQTFNARLAAIRLATRARAARFRCAAPAAGDTAPAAMPRLLTAAAGAWTGGHRSLAAAAGFARIEPGCDPRLAPTCFAPALDAGDVADLQIAA